MVGYERDTETETKESKHLSVREKGKQSMDESGHWVSGTSGNTNSNKVLRKNSWITKGIKEKHGK